MPGPPEKLARHAVPRRIQNRNDNCSYRQKIGRTQHDPGSPRNCDHHTGVRLIELGGRYVPGFGNCNSQYCERTSHVQRRSKIRTKGLDLAPDTSAHLDGAMAC